MMRDTPVPWLDCERTYSRERLYLTPDGRHACRVFDVRFFEGEYREDVVVSTPSHVCYLLAYDPENLVEVDRYPDSILRELDIRGCSAAFTAPGGWELYSLK